MSPSWLIMIEKSEELQKAIRETAENLGIEEVTVAEKLGTVWDNLAHSQQTSALFTIWDSYDKQDRKAFRKEMRNKTIKHMKTHGGRK